MRIKSYTLMSAIFVIGMAISACAAKIPSQDIETTAATVAATEAEDTRNVAETKGEKEIMTYGIYQFSETGKDVNGEYTQATFVDDYGMEFVANIGEETVMPEKLEEGKTYMVIHSEMMTMSVPGIYPEVYKIEESDTGIYSNETMDHTTEDITEKNEETEHTADTVEQEP